jgi:hypothetical protein
MLAKSGRNAAERHPPLAGASRQSVRRAVNRSCPYGHYSQEAPFLWSAGNAWRSGRLHRRESLAFPFQRKRPHRSRHHQLRPLPPCQNRLHDLRRQQRHAHHRTDVGRVDFLGLGDVVEGLYSPFRFTSGLIPGQSAVLKPNFIKVRTHPPWISIMAQDEIFTSRPSRMDCAQASSTMALLMDSSGESCIGLSSRTASANASTIRR